jgi:hypothetical protein
MFFNGSGDCAKVGECVMVEVEGFERFKCMI